MLIVANHANKAICRAKPNGISRSACHEFVEGHPLSSLASGPKLNRQLVGGSFALLIGRFALFAITLELP